MKPLSSSQILQRSFSSLLVAVPLVGETATAACPEAVRRVVGWNEHEARPTGPAMEDEWLRIADLQQSARYQFDSGELESCVGHPDWFGRESWHGQ